MTRRAEPRLPQLAPSLQGLRAGELRIVTLPPRHAFGGRPDRGLDVDGDETIVYEIDCVEVWNGPRVELSNGLIVEDLVIGAGRAAEIGSYAAVRWKAWNQSGDLLGQSEGEADLFIVQLPTLQPPAVRGWNHGIPGMRVGGTRRLVVPSDLAYGQEPSPESGVGPGESVTYEITLLGAGRSPNSARADALR